MKFKLKKDIPFKELTTFRTGGSAKFLAEVDTKEELLDAVRFAGENKLPVFVMGGGSDVLISDENFRGVVIKYVGTKLGFKSIGNNRVLVKAESGMVWDDLVKAAVEKKLQGIECLSGIPGSVGAAPIQNIGAYGQELKNVFVKLSAYDLKRKVFREFSNQECQFDYRESIFKKPTHKRRFIITDITLMLNKMGNSQIIYQSLTDYFKEKGINNPTLVQVRRGVLEVRGRKLEDPKVLGNAGSFFKNPIVPSGLSSDLKKKYPDIPVYPMPSGVKLFAGWLIEKSGWKGKRYKNAAVSQKNALVIVNPEGKATSEEIRELAEKISDDVYKKFKVRLEPEVQYIDFG